MRRRSSVGALALVACFAPACGADRGEGGEGGGSDCGDACNPAPEDCGAPLTHTGEATFYDFADGSGNCGFDPSPDDLMIGAMNHVDYADSRACGACVRLDGPNASITIRVVDQCPECPEGDIDLSPEAFEQIAPLSDGRVPITWQYVACDVAGPLRYHFKEGSNPWWTAVQIRNHRQAIATLEYKDANGAWIGVPRESYNYFVEASGMGEGPYAFRVTDVFGGVVEDEGIPFVEAGDSESAAQLPACAP